MHTGGIHNKGMKATLTNKLASSPLGSWKLSEALLPKYCVFYLEK